MAAVGRGFGRQALSLWDQMSASQKVMVLLAIALGVIAIILLLSRSEKPDLVPLYTNLRAEDAADIVAKLRELRVAYEISSGGSTIKVPFADVYETRMALASEGLPRGGSVGFELFDKTSFGATEFTQKMNYIRALQGELTRTILQLREVEEARVHIAIPEPRLYTDEEKPPTASVMVKLRSGGVLGRGQIQGIVRLVASSVEGLSPNNVTVLDVSGNVLYASSGDGSEESAASSLSLSQLEAKRTYEKDLEKSVQSMLAEVLGARRVVVRVNAELDFDRAEQESETFQPLGSGLGVIREQERILETRSASTATDGTSGRQPVGSDANMQTQGAGGGGAVYRVGAGQGEATSEQRTEETTRYEISRIVEHRVKPPGALKRISVAAIVSAPLTEQQQQAITRSIGAAVGIDAARGDSLIVEAMEFGEPLGSESGTQPLSSANAARRSASFGTLLLDNIEYLLAAIIGLFLVGFVVSLTRQRLPAPPTFVPAPSGVPVEQLAASAESAMAGAPVEHAARETIAAPPTLKPETAARVISGWMDEDKR